MHFIFTPRNSLKTLGSVKFNAPSDFNRCTHLIYGHWLQVFVELFPNKIFANFSHINSLQFCVNIAWPQVKRVFAKVHRVFAFTNVRTQSQKNCWLFAIFHHSPELTALKMIKVLFSTAIWHFWDFFSLKICFRSNNFPHKIRAIFALNIQRSLESDHLPTIISGDARLSHSMQSYWNPFELTIMRKNSSSE